MAKVSSSDTRKCQIHVSLNTLYGSERRFYILTDDEHFESFSTGSAQGGGVGVGEGGGLRQTCEHSNFVHFFRRPFRSSANINTSLPPPPPSHVTRF